MTFKIHYNGDYFDEVIVHGESVEEVRQLALAECEKRGWDTQRCWSERL